MMSAFSWKLIFVTMLIWASQAFARSLQDVSMVERHEQWMARYGRVYKDNAEKEMRYKIFKQNVNFIETFNKAGNQSYQLGINGFADLTNDEFRATHNGYITSSNKPNASSFRYENVTVVPSSIDWREKGAVTQVKHQRQCGCCWAFSAVAAVEGINQISTGKLISLSEQELLDCNTQNRGCNGGWMDLAFEFIKENNGITTESNYPYRGTQGTCNAENESSEAVKITGYEDVPRSNEESLLKAVTNQPVSVAIDGSGKYFQFYRGGVFSEEYCTTQQTHAVTAVGYGTSSDGTKYWLVKNSWGTSWGENGYIRMQRDIDAAEGTCGIAMHASYPTV